MYEEYKELEKQLREVSGDARDTLQWKAADAITTLNKEVMALRSDYWDVTCDPEYRESHFQKDEWGEW